MSPRARVRHERVVLDTSTVILLTRIQDEHLLPAEPLITTVTLAELSVGPLLAATDEERAARQSQTCNKPNRTSIGLTVVPVPVPSLPGPADPPSPRKPRAKR